MASGLPSALIHWAPSTVRRKGGGPSGGPLPRLLQRMTGVENLWGTVTQDSKLLESLLPEIFFFSFKIN